MFAPFVLPSIMDVVSYPRPFGKQRACPFALKFNFEKPGAGVNTPGGRAPKAITSLEAPELPSRHPFARLVEWCSIQRLTPAQVRATTGSFANKQLRHRRFF